MSDSSLVTGVCLTNNHYDGRGAYQITRITPHYMAWYTDGRTCAESFLPAARRASANYCIGKDGDIILNVHESNAPWTSGSYDNDNRAITIECANYDKTKDGHLEGELPKATWDSLVALCADIVVRNGFKRLEYTGDLYRRDVDSMLLTMHKWFQDTDCPGPWLSEQFERLAYEVNAKIIAKESKMIDPSNIAALIHHDMCTDPRNGYNQAPVRWGGNHPDGIKTLDIDGHRYEYALGDYDCSSSVITAWKQALRYTPYEGVLEKATYTGNMREVFELSGLFKASYSPAKRGDLYLCEHAHTAMCQDGGSDGVFGYDCLSEFNRNENHSASDGKPGDQDDNESVIREFYDYNGRWDTVLHYVGGLLRDVTNDDDDPVDVNGDDSMAIVCVYDNKQYYWDGIQGHKPKHLLPGQLDVLSKIHKHNTGKGLVSMKIDKAGFEALESI